MVEGNKNILAIDKAIGENGFRVVTLLFLSPLLPYILGSWLGMLPEKWAYVSAGASGRAIIEEESQLGLAGVTNQLLMLGVGLLATTLTATYVIRLAKVEELIMDIALKKKLQDGNEQHNKKLRQAGPYISKVCIN